MIPFCVDKLVALTFGNIAYDAILDGKSGLMSALVNGCYELVPILIPLLNRASWMLPPPTTPTDTARCMPSSRDCPFF